MAHEHLLNADFDLSLRPRWSGPGAGRARRRIADMAWHALHLAGDGDTVLVPEAPPEDFVRYLRSCGLELPELTIEPEICTDNRLLPFGWNRRAAELNRRYPRPARHPDLETVRQVNGRRYAARIEVEWRGDAHVTGVAETLDELLRLIADDTSAPSGWVIKSEHGNAGLGNRRIRRRDPTADDLDVVRRMLEEDDAVVVERWRSRLRDLCVTFQVGTDGRTHDVHVHETVNTADGAFLGALFEADEHPIGMWREPMHDAADSLATQLAADGYSGPACIDGFVWDDHGESRLRPLVDLNARRQISAGAAALWRRFPRRGAAYWRFFNRRKIELPASYDELVRAFGDDAFDPRADRGVLVTAPLWIGPDRRPSDTAAMLIAGRDRDEVFAVDRRIRARFEG
jgi:hypothetical protein